MIHPEHGLIVFIDMQPSEQEQSDELKNTFGVVCGVFFKNELLTFSNLRQYKDTPFHERIATSQEITKQLIMQGVMTIGCYTKFSEMENYGNALLEIIPEELAKRKSVGKLHFKNKKINEKIAKILPWYTYTLLEIVRDSIKYAKQKGQSKLFLALDNLPGDSVTSLAFLNLICNDPFFKKELTKYQDENQIEITYGNIESHPGMTYIDWLVHSLHAFVNDADAIDKPASRTEEYRKEIASIWECLEMNERAKRIHFTLMSKHN